MHTARETATERVARAREDLLAGLSLHDLMLDLERERSRWGWSPGDLASIEVELAALPLHRGRP